MNDLRNMTEKERIKTYVSKYISYIENLDYEKAYSLLNEDFKQNYFNNNYIFYIVNTKKVINTILGEYYFF